MFVRASASSGGGGVINPIYDSTLIKNVSVVSGVDTTNNKGFIIGTFTTATDIPANTPIFSGITKPSSQVTISDSAVYTPNLGLSRTGVITTNGEVYVTTIIGHVGTGRDLVIACYYDL